MPLIMGGGAGRYGSARCRILTTLWRITTRHQARPPYRQTRSGDGGSRWSGLFGRHSSLRSRQTRPRPPRQPLLTRTQLRAALAQLDILQGHLAELLSALRQSQAADKVEA
jgi:hypothetical protein